ARHRRPHARGADDADHRAEGGGSQGGGGQEGGRQEVMTGRKQITAFTQRELAAHEAKAAAKTAAGEALTPYEKLLRAAENGEFEALVRQSRPAEPPAMITPQEREAELRAQGR